METVEKWLTLQEISEHIQASRESILAWIVDKKMPAHKLGKLWRFKVSEVDEWIKSGGAE